MLFLLIRADTQPTGSSQVFNSYYAGALYNPVLEGVHVLLISCLSGITFASKLTDRFVINMLTRTSLRRILFNELKHAWGKTAGIYAAVMVFYYAFITVFGLPLGITLFSTDPATLTPADASFQLSLIRQNLGLNGLLNLGFALLVTVLQIGVISVITFTFLLKTTQLSIALFLPWLIYQVSDWVLNLVPNGGVELAPGYHVLEFPSPEFTAGWSQALAWPLIVLLFSFGALILVARNPRTLEAIA